MVAFTAQNTSFGGSFWRLLRHLPVVFTAQNAGFAGSFGRLLRLLPAAFTAQNAGFAGSSQSRLGGVSAVAELSVSLASGPAQPTADPPRRQRPVSLYSRPARRLGDPNPHLPSGAFSSHRMAVAFVCVCVCVCVCWVGVGFTPTYYQSPRGRGSSCRHTHIESSPEIADCLADSFLRKVAFTERVGFHGSKRGPRRAPLPGMRGPTNRARPAFWCFF